MHVNQQGFSKILTIGTFDGVHLGHQKILNRVVNLSKRKKCLSAVLTFFPHPRMVLQQNAEIKLLNTIQEREALLKRFGIEAIFVKTFTAEFANLSPKQYVKDILLDELNAKELIIGYDHHFGKNRSANINDLKKFAKAYSFEVHEIDAKDIDEVTISSTKIRNALENGNVALANKYLGYNYFITGNVINGQRIGRELEFPTANIHIKEDYKLIPKDGVYVVKSEISNKIIYGMMNIGTNPTIKNKTRSIEVHYFEFKGDLYGETLEIEILQRLRDEKKYESLEQLKKQLSIDKENALNYVATL